MLVYDPCSLLVDLSIDSKDFRVAGAGFHLLEVGTGYRQMAFFIISGGRDYVGVREQASVNLLSKFRGRRGNGGARSTRVFSIDGGEVSSLVFHLGGWLPFSEP